MGVLLVESHGAGRPHGLAMRPVRGTYAKPGGTWAAHHLAL